MGKNVAKKWTPVQAAAEQSGTQAKPDVVLKPNVEPVVEPVAETTAEQASQPICSVPAVLQSKADALLVVTKQLQLRLGALLHEPKFQIASVSGGGGALTFGAVGGSCGLVAGSTAGFAVGIVPSLLTLGLSIPVCTVAGGSLGMGAGAVTGGSIGFIGGGIVGGAAYAYRVEIKDNIVLVQAKVVDIVSKTSDMASTKAIKARAKVGDTGNQARQAILSCIKSVSGQVRTKSSELSAGTKRTIADPCFRVSAASAAGGAVVLGTSGGGLGLAAGTVTGAAVGLVPALFTFGLSIPIGAVLGGGAGLCVGVTAGSTAGIVGGGAVGYGTYSKRKEINEVAGDVWTRAQDKATYIRGKATESATYVKTRVLG